MICNFFVAGSSIFAHRKANALVRPIIQWLIPISIVGIILGVALSNCSLFAGKNSYLLTRIFGGFLIYVAIFNIWNMYQDAHPPQENLCYDQSQPYRIISIFIGSITGICAGLLGIGAGTVATPLQQLLLKIKIKNAMSNSAAMIVSMAWLGAIYKNATLYQHEVHFTDSFRIAVFVIPTAVLGGYLGGHLMHALPRKLVQVLFIIMCILASIELITAQPT